MGIGRIKMSEMFGASTMCPRCGSSMNPVGLKDHTRVGWYCERCSGLMPDEGIRAITHKENYD